MKICVIGAGPSGIAGLKALKDQGFKDITCYDRGSAVGGNWVFDAESGHSSVFETTHIISSKLYSQYEDYPMPADYPEYPSHRQLAAYFQGYARHFRLLEHIHFEHTVVTADKQDKGWRVTATGPDGTVTQDYDFLLVANGHHWKPRYPDYPGTWTGQWLHSHDYKRAEPFRDKRVLVIGGGNSACDVSVETSRVSKYTDISMRRGYWIIPKFMDGQPSDVFAANAEKLAGWLPQWIKVRFFHAKLRKAMGDLTPYGMQAPDHDVMETHPTMNSELVYFIRHGKVGPRPDIERLDGQSVYFTDGTTREYDAIVCCTGFEIAHPFLDTGLINYSHGVPRLLHKMLPADVEGIAFLGLFQPLGCIWPGAELQAKIIARMLDGSWAPPADLEAAITQELNSPDVRQVDTPRHTITVHHHKFLERLRKELPSDYVSRAPHAA